MSNKQTTWELKAVDNLSEVILRMEQMVKLQQQQAALSSTASRDIQIQMNGVASSYKSVETAIDKATTASKEQATETANVKSKFDALKSTVTPLTTIISNVYAGAKSKEFISEITQVDGKVNVLSKSFTEIISDVQKYSNEAKSAFAQVKAATDGARITDVTYQQQIEGRVVSTLEKIGRIEARMQELAAKQSQLANKEQAETAQLIQQKELIIAKIDKINLTYGSLGARTEQQQDQWDAALRKTYAELDKVEGKIEQMPNKTAAENAKLEKQFDSLTTQVKGAVSSLVSAENQLEKLGVESQKSEGYIGKLRAEVDRLKELRGFAKTEEEVRALNVELNKAETNLQEIEGGGKKITDSFSSIKGTLAAFLGIYELISAVKAIFDLTAQWEKYEAVLKTALGSQELATRSLEMLQSFADKTNFTLDELADTFIKFANRGLIVTQNELAKVGDVANALGKPFKDLGEAMLDINNTERWNELGIKAKTAGDKVSLTFKGVTIEVEKTEQGVLRAVTAFGTLNGVQGQTDEIAKTLGGKMSTLSDGVSGLGRAIGEGLTPIFGGFIDASSQVVGWLTQQFSSTSALVPVFNLLGTTLSIVWGYFAQLGEKLNEMTGGVFPALFGWLTDNGNAMKLFATIIQVAIVGPFQLMVMGFQEIYQASQLVWNGFQGLIAGLQAVKAAMTLDFTGAKESINLASDYFTKAGTNFSNMGAIYTKTNADFTNSLKTIWAEAQTVAVAVDDTNKKLNAEQLKAVAAENERWKNVSANMKQGTGEYAQAYADHLLKLQEADGTHTKKSVEAEKDKGKQKKEQAFMSATEISKLTKEIQEESLKSQIELIEINMKIEIDLINNHKNSKIKTEAEAQEAIKAIIAKAEKDKEELIKKSRVDIQATELAHTGKVVELANKLVLDVQASEVQRIMNTQLSADERARIDAETLAKIEASRKREQEIIRETEAIEKESYNERIKKVIGFIGSLSSGLADFANFAIGMVDNMDLISGKTVKTYQTQVENAQAASAAIKILYTEDSEQYADSMVKVQETKRNLTEAEAASSMASLNMAMAVADIMQKVAKAINDKLIETNTAIIEAYDTIERVMSDYYDTLIVINKNSLDEQLKDFRGTYEEREKIIDEHYSKQSEYAEAKGLIEYQTAYIKLTLENDSKMKSDMTAHANKQMGQLVANMYAQQALEEEHRIKKLNREIETAEEIRDKKIQALEESRDAEIAAQKVITETVSNELELLDTKRKQLLDSWLARKLKDLEDDKALALEQADTEEEKSNIIIKYQGLTEEAHKKYKEAELDKSKQVALATTELKAQEADFIKNKENETAGAIRTIQQQTTQMIRQANQEIFEANKQIIIAELQGEIAKLKAKRWFMNAGKVDAAVSTIEGVIASIQGASLGGGVNTGGIDGDMGTNEKYEESGRKANEIAEKAREALQSVDQSLMDARSKTGEIDGQLQEARRKAEEAGRISIVVPKDENGVPLAEGTAYVEGFGYPDGRDTVPAWIDKGERILSKSLNALLGGRSVTNEELVAKKIFADKVLERSGSLKTNTLLAPLPIAMLSGASGGNNGQWEEMANKIVEAVNKPNINISASPYGLTVEEIGRNRQHKTYYKNTPFAKLTP